MHNICLYYIYMVTGAIVSLAVLGAGFQMEVIKSPNVDFDESPGSNCSHYRCVDITNINHDSWLC